MPSSPYPVRVGPTRRYLVDRHGAPWLLHGDTAWSLITALRREEAERYLADRAALGFNAIIVNLIEHKFNGPATREGLLPFARPGDFSALVDAYFDHAAWCGNRGRLRLSLLQRRQIGRYSIVQHLANTLALKLKYCAGCPSPF